MSRRTDRPISLAQRVADFVPTFSLIVAGAALCTMLVLVLAEVIARNLFQYGLPFTVEYSEYAVPVVGLVGAAYTLRIGEHVSADIVFGKLPALVQQWLVLIGNLVGLGLMVLLARQSFIMAFINIERNAVALYPTLTRLGYPQLIMGFGFSLFSLQLAIEVVRTSSFLRRRNVPPDQGRNE